MAELIAGRYEPLRHFDERSGIEVLLGRDHHHDRTVALKIRIATDDAARRKLLAEARVLLQLAPHPALPVVRDDFFDGDRHVMVVDWIDGVSLEQLLTERGEPGLSPSAVMSYLGDVAGALDHLHANDPAVVHGNIRPANLIVDEAGHTVLVNPGMAVASRTAIERASACAAPEVLRGEKPTTASDIYSFCATAHVLLTGDVDGPASALLRAMGHGLAEDPTRRPARAADVVDRLRAWHGATLPTGVLTFLFTDVANSAQLWDADPSATARSFARHDQLVTEQVESHHGRLVKCYGERRATVCAFPDAANAIVAALAIRASPTHLKLRFALHTGDSDLRDADYHGAVVHHGTLMRRIAQPNQILVSATTAAEVAGRLPTDASLADLGAREFGGAVAAHVFQLCAADEVPVVLPAPPNSVAPLDRPMVGREAELTELSDDLERAAGGHGAVVLIGGEAGIGKTRIAEEIARVASDRGLTTLWGHCHADEGAPAFWPWVRVFATYAERCDLDTLQRELADSAAHLANLVPELASRIPTPAAITHVGGSEARFRQFEAILRFLRRAALRNPLLVVLDDLHWADPSTLLLLEFLGREIGSVPMLVIGTYRDDEVGRDHPLKNSISELSRITSTRRLLLESLSTGEVRTLLQHQTAAEPTDALVRAVMRQTEGNPLFATEVVRLLVAEGRLDDAAGWEHPIPATVRNVIMRRLRRQSRDTEELLATASVIGRAFDLRVLAAAAGRALDDVNDSLMTAVEARVIGEEPGPGLTFRFTHDLIRQVLYESLGATRRALIHLRIGEALERRASAPAAELAYHFGEASRLEPHPRAVQYLEEAGNEATALFAWERAGQCYERALAIERALHQDATRQCELLANVADVHARSGDRTLARMRYEELAVLARDGRRYDELARAALGAGRSGSHFMWVESGLVDASLIGLLEEAIVAVPDHTAEKAKLLAALATQLYFDGTSANRRRALSDAALALARSLDDIETLMFVVGSRHTALWSADNLNERVALAGEALRLANAIGDREYVVWALELTIANLVELGAVDELQHHLDELNHRAEELHVPVWRWFAVVHKAQQAILHGALDDAAALATAAFELGAALHHTESEQVFGAQLFVILREQGRLLDVEAAVDANVGRYPEVTAWRAVRALVRAETHRIDEAAVDLDAIVTRELASLPRDFYWAATIATLGEVCAAVGDRPSAKRLYEALRTIDGQIVVGGASVVVFGAAAHFLGRLATTLGQLDGAVAHLTAAETTHLRLRSAPLVCRSRLALAEARFRRSEPDAATELLDEVMPTAASLGLQSLVTHARALRAEMA